MADDSITPEEYEGWLPPRAALNELKPTGYDAAAALVLDHCRLGEMRASYKLFSGPNIAALRVPSRYGILHGEVWRTATDPDLDETLFWDTGTIKLYDNAARRRRIMSGSTPIPPSVTILGVRFDPAGINGLRPAPPAARFSSAPAPIPQDVRSAISHASPPGGALGDLVQQVLATRRPVPNSADTTPHAGGRPRKDFWEPLLVAAGIAIYAGFTPKNIAEVERWMADWLSERGYDAGEVAIRTRARLLFSAYAAERDKN